MSIVSSTNQQEMQHDDALVVKESAYQKYKVPNDEVEKDQTLQGLKKVDMSKIATSSIINPSVLSTLGTIKSADRREKYIEIP